MKDEKMIRYEKPAMSAYDFAVRVACGATPAPGGDIEEGCSEPGWDDEA